MAKVTLRKKIDTPSSPIFEEQIPKSLLTSFNSYNFEQDKTSERDPHNLEALNHAYSIPFSEFIFGKSQPSTPCESSSSSKSTSSTANRLK